MSVVITQKSEIHCKHDKKTIWWRILNDQRQSNIIISHRNYFKFHLHLSWWTGPLRGAFFFWKWIVFLTSFISYTLFFLYSFSSLHTIKMKLVGKNLYPRVNFEPLIWNQFVCVFLVGYGDVPGTEKVYFKLITSLLLDINTNVSVEGENFLLVDVVFQYSVTVAKCILRKSKVFSLLRKIKNIRWWSNCAKCSLNCNLHKIWFFQSIYFFLKISLPTKKYNLKFYSYTVCLSRVSTLLK